MAFLLRNQQVLAHGEAPQILEKLQIQKGPKEKGLGPKSRGLKRPHVFGILTDPNLLIPLGAPLLDS